MTRAGNNQATRYALLRNQPPEKDTGSFDPVQVYQLLRSGSAYSLPSRQPWGCAGQASRVPISGRSRPDTTTMHDTRRQDTADIDGSFTSFTSGVFAEVNEITDRRRRSVPLLFTSFTSFSEGSGLHAGGRARGRARFNLMPIRDPSERSEREGCTPDPSVDYPVHFGTFTEVNKPVSFTPRGVVA